MKWNLRLAAANRGIWKATELQRLLAERGVVISAGKIPLRGWQRRNAIAALRSLFRFAKKRGLIFANPTTRLGMEDIHAVCCR